MPVNGLKKQVLGGVLFCVGAITVLLARTIGFELDGFYIVICIFGACLFLYGTMQKKQHKLASQSASVRQRISMHGD
jgi:glucose uptake protein GlcU